MRWTCVLLLFELALRGQYQVDSWTTDNGLPQNIIRGIHQTADGYLWLVTLDGVVRFDGVRFTVFDRSNSPGIASNRFTSIQQDLEGSLWFGTENGGVTRYQRGQFTSFSVHHGLISNKVMTLSADDDGTLLIASGAKVMRWSKDRFLLAENNFPDQLSALGAIFRGNRPSGLFAVGEGVLYRYRGGIVTRHPGIPTPNVREVAESPDGTLWVMTRDRGLLKVGGGLVTPVRPPVPGLYGFVSYFLHQPTGTAVLSKSSRGELWLADLEQKSERLIVRSPPSGLWESDRYASYEDREKNLWIGSEGRGLFRIRKEAVTTVLRGRNVYPIYEDRGGGVWAGADHLNRMPNGVNGSERQIGPPILVKSILQDRTGQMWIGSYLGLQIFADGRLGPPLRIPGFEAKPPYAAIFEDRAGGLWLAAEGVLARRHKGAIKVFSATDGYNGQNVMTLTEDAKGDVWIGSYGGLSRFRDGRFQNWTDRDGLPSNSVRAVYSDGDGVLWIGTYDGGLARFKDGVFTKFTVKEGLYNNGAFQILEDGRSNLWISCNRGIYRLSKEELNAFAEGRRTNITSVAYGKSDGMANMECNGGALPAGIKTKDGRLLFPTQDGIAVVDPQAVPINPHAPPVTIESFQVDQKAVTLSPVVKLPFDQDNFEIRYTAPSFINSERIRFKYRLESLDREWIEAGSRRTAYYSHVPPGDYVFHVTAANSDGVWNAEGQTLRVSVLPPFYRTWWFMLIAALSAAFALQLAVRGRIREFKNAQAAQQAFSRALIASQEGERKRIAAELHDSLGQRLVVVKNLALLYLNRQDEKDAQHYVQELADETSRAMNEVKEISYALRPYQLDRLGLTKAIAGLLRTASSTGGPEFSSELDDIDGFFSKELEINFYRIVQESVNNILKHAKASNASVSVRRKEKGLILTIHDNGEGFDTGAISEGRNGGGFGLLGIRERVQLLGGRSAINSMLGKGTTITITIEGRNHGRANSNRRS